MSTTKIVKLAKHFKTLFKLFSVRGTAYIFISPRAYASIVAFHALSFWFDDLFPVELIIAIDEGGVWWTSIM